jgi:superfamily II DNA/RNA helicase
LSKPAEGVLQAVYLVHDEQKIQLIKSLIADKPAYKSILIFTSKKVRVTEITRALKGQGYDVTGISSNLDQSDREEVMKKFRAKRIRVLVGTDVISRGIDIKDINLVINYDVPSNAEDYVHRVGRTARADTTGVALTLVNPRDMSLFHEVEELIGMEIKKLDIPKEIGQSPTWNPTKQRGPKRHAGGKKSYGRGGSNSRGGRNAGGRSSSGRSSSGGQKNRDRS